MHVGAATGAGLNASNSAVDAALSAANVTSQMNIVNDIITAADNITDLLTARDSNNRLTSQINDSCEYSHIQHISLGFIFSFD